MRLALVLALALVAVSPALAEEGSRMDRHIDRMVASPGPVPPIDLVSDAWTWRVDVDVGAVVLVDASGGATAPFVLRARGWDAPEPLPSPPSAHQSAILGAGAWSVEVDPQLGASVHIVVRFEGHVGDVGGAPWDLRLSDVSAGLACGPAGACLP